MRIGKIRLTGNRSHFNANAMPVVNMGFLGNKTSVF